MTETRNKYNPKPFSVLAQIARIDRARSRQKTAEDFCHAVLCVCVGFALGVLAFSFAGAFTL